jgi:hypothetical protein
MAWSSQVFLKDGSFDVTRSKITNVSGRRKTIWRVKRSSFFAAYAPVQSPATYRYGPGSSKARISPVS